MGGCLEIKLVKPIKISSRAANERGFDQIRFPQAKPNVWATRAGVLGKADAAVGQELGSFDPSDSVIDQLSKFSSLFVGDGSAEVLNLDQALANEDNLGDLGDARDPGVADELGIEHEQPSRFFGVSAGSSFPLEQARRPVEGSDGIDVG